MKTFADQIASTVNALHKCRKGGNTEWEQRHSEYLEGIFRECGPSGGGIDMGVSLVEESSDLDKLTFLIPYHHMDENGYYVGWEDYVLEIRPIFHLKLTGKFLEGEDSNGVHEYLYDVMCDWLESEWPGV